MTVSFQIYTVPLNNLCRVLGVYSQLILMNDFGSSFYNVFLTFIKFPLQELSVVEKFRSQGGAMVREFCPYGTRDECDRSNTEKRRCKKVKRKVVFTLFNYVQWCFIYWMETSSIARC